MKRYLTILGLLAIAAGLQTGCIWTDGPFLGTDAVGWQNQDHFSNQGINCLTLDNDGGGSISANVHDATAWMCKPRPQNYRIFEPCIASMNRAQATRIWGHTGAGIVPYAATLYYGIGSNTYGYEFAPTGIAEIGVSQPSYILRTSTVPGINPDVYKWGCAIESWYFAGLPEGADRGSYGSVPSMVVVDSAQGCQFWTNIQYLDPTIWFTNTGGIYPTQVPPNRWDPFNRKYTNALAFCIDNSFNGFPVGFLPDVVLKNVGCGDFAFGTPQSFSLKSGEASMKYSVNLDEESGWMVATITGVTLRDKSITLQNPIRLPMGKEGRTFAINGAQAGWRELLAWAIKDVDLSKPFQIGGEYLPWAGLQINTPGQLAVSKEGLQAMLDQGTRVSAELGRKK